MKSVRTGSTIGDISVVATLLSLALAWPGGTQAGSPEGRDDSVAPAVVTSASQAKPDPARREPAGEQDRSLSGSDDAAPGLELALDGSAEGTAQFPEIPLAAVLLVGVCILGAGLGPHARRGAGSTEENAPRAEAPAGREARRIG
jgi:hypothetical protein